MLNLIRGIVLLLAVVLYLLKNVFYYSPLYINVLNDLLAIPVFLMVMAFLMKKIYGNRFHLNLLYVFVTVSVISILFEWIFPFLSEKATGDPVDVLLYFIGGGLYCLFLYPHKIFSTQR